MKQSSLYKAIIIGASVGVAASFIQLLEKLTLLRNKDAILSCDISAVFSCSDVLNSWQSSVFGFPNAIICLILFTFMLTASFIGLRCRLSRRFRLVAQALAVTMLLFAVWFLLQSIFVINALCVLCLLCFAGLLLTNWAWGRINLVDYRLSDGPRAKINTLLGKDYDVLFWLCVGLSILLLAVIRFA